MTLTNWLTDVFGLFHDTLGAVMAVPVLRLFLGVALFLVVVALMIYLIRQGRREN